MSERARRQLCENAATREKECSALNVWQLRRLLTMYTHEGEQKLPLEVLAKLVATGNNKEGKSTEGRGRQENCTGQLPELRKRRGGWRKGK